MTGTQTLFFRRDRFSWLLMFLLILYLTSAVLPESDLGLLTVLIKLLMVVSILYVIETAFTLTNGRKLAGRAVAIILVLLLVSGLFSSAPLLQVAVSLTMILLLVITLLLTVNALVNTNRVDRDVLSAGIFGYAALVILFAALYSIFLTLSPESFHFNTGLPGSLGGVHGDTSIPLYFSLVTITTLGYGDITPATVPAQLTATFQAFLGQIYLAVMIARLVGLHVVSVERNHKV